MSADGYIETVHRAAEEKGVQILFETRGTELMTDEKQRGDRRSRREKRRHETDGQRGEGRHSGDRRLWRRFGQGARNPFGYPRNDQDDQLFRGTGDGIWTAQAIGAEAIDLDQIQLYPLASAVDGSTGYAMVGPTTAMYVNAKGERYVNENERRDVLAAAAFAQGGVIYCISDSVAAQNTRDIDVVH